MSFYLLVFESLHYTYVYYLPTRAQLAKIVSSAQSIWRLLPFIHLGAVSREAHKAKDMNLGIALLQLLLLVLSTFENLWRREEMAGQGEQVRDTA